VLCSIWGVGGGSLNNRGVGGGSPNNNDNAYKNETINHNQP